MRGLLMAARFRFGASDRSKVWRTVVRRGVTWSEGAGACEDRPLCASFATVGRTESRGDGASVDRSALTLLGRSATVTAVHFRLAPIEPQGLSMPRPLSLAIATTVAALCLASAASAAVPGYAYTGGFEAAPSPTTIGLGFYTFAPITITQLGAIDVGGGGLSSATPVGLWDDAGNLLSSTSVPAGTGPVSVGGFRYAPITPVALAAETVYWVGMLSTNTSSISQVTPKTAPELTLLNGGLYTFTRSGRTLQFPKDNIQFGTIAGANFQFVVPEPASLSLLALAAPLLRRRRK